VFCSVVDQFTVWGNAGGKSMQGLINLHAKEKALFLSWSKHSCCASCSQPEQRIRFW